MRLPIALLAGAFAGLTTVALADERVPFDCYDAVVVASTVRQTPTIAQRCGDDCILVAWPWIVELNVAKVLQGTVPRGRLTVLTVQHTYRRLDAHTTWLRRNSAGGFNVVSVDPNDKPRRCSADVLAVPYIQAPDGKTLSDLAAEGEAFYGPGPDSSKAR